MKFISRIAAILAVLGLLMQPMNWACVAGDALCCPGCAAIHDSPKHWTGPSCHVHGNSAASGVRCDFRAQVLALSKASSVEPGFAAAGFVSTSVFANVNSARGRSSGRQLRLRSSDCQSLLSVFRI
jgi:hypothetical protein